MLKRITSISLIFAIIYFMSGSILWAQQKAKIPQKQYNTTKLNLFMKNTQAEATSLKQLIDRLHSSTSQNRAPLLKNIVAKANTLLSSAKNLHAEVDEANKVHLNENQSRTVARNLADLSTLVEEMQHGLTAGSVDFSANCGESPCLETACAACCRSQFSEPLLLQNCLDHCSAQADMCQALEILREAMEAQAESTRSISF